MKIILTFLKVCFLIALLVANVVGFTYYHEPVNADNLHCIPPDSKMVVTINLKSISGKLLQELLFHPDDFEKELISERERKLVMDNTTYGVNPFSRIAFFVFSHGVHTYRALAFCVSEKQDYAQKLEDKNYKSYTVDGISVYEGNGATFFLFEKSAVMVMSSMSKEEAENIAVKKLQNETAYPGIDPMADFQVICKKDLLKGSLFESYFSLLPPWVSQISITGNFESEQIHLEGEMLLDKNIKIPDYAGTFSPPSLKQTQSHYLQFMVSGSVFESQVHRFLEEVTLESADTTGFVTDLLKREYEGMKITINKLRMNTDVLSLSRLSSRGLPGPAVDMSLSLDSKDPVNFRFIYANMRPVFKNGYHFPQDVLHISMEKVSITKDAQLFFYFDPDQFLAASEVNVFVSAFLEPMMIFKDVLLSVTQIANSVVYFKGQIRFKNTDAHSIIQMRSLVKGLSALI